MRKFSTFLKETVSEVKKIVLKKKPVNVLSVE